MLVHPLIQKIIGHPSHVLVLGDAAIDRVTQNRDVGEGAIDKVLQAIAKMSPEKAELLEGCRISLQHLGQEAIGADVGHLKPIVHGVVEGRACGFRNVQEVEGMCLRGNDGV